MNKLFFPGVKIVMLIGCFYSLSVFSQDVRYITIKEAIHIAHQQSVDGLVVKNNLLVAYWTYKNYLADLLPNANLTGTLPQINKSLSSYQVEDGSYKFVRNSAIQENLNLSISQNIPLTGGQIGIQSQIQRIDELDGSKRTSYLSVPLSLVLTQPLITHNPLKWAKKIEPLRYQESIKTYYTELEAISVKTINYFFDLLLSSINKDIAEKNFKNATTLYEVALGKKKLGLLSDNDLLQLELSRLNALSNVTTTQQAYFNKMLILKNYLQLYEVKELIPITPDRSYNDPINYERALAYANENNPLNNRIERKVLESKKNTAYARSNRGFEIDTYVAVGFTGSDTKFVDAYSDLKDRQVISLGFRIPILDWGKGKGTVKIAESQQKIVESQVVQEKINFEQEIQLTLNEYHSQKALVDIAHRADSIADLRYEVAHNTFLIGQISVLDISTAQVERDNAKRKFINELYLSWVYYYKIRQITLFDFQNNRSLISYNLKK